MSKNPYQLGKENLIKDIKRWQRDFELATDPMDADEDTFDGSAYFLFNRFINLYTLKTKKHGNHSKINNTSKKISKQ